MRFLKIALGTVVALAVLLGTTGFFLTDTWKIERSIAINAPPDVVFFFFDTAEGWEAWTSWAAAQDPSWRMTPPEGQTAGAGATFRWESDQYGGHTVTLDESLPPSDVRYTMRIEKMQMEMRGHLSATPAGAETTVTWTETGDIGKNPYARWMARLTRDMVGKDFEQGLLSMKAKAEARAQALEARRAEEAAAAAAAAAAAPPVDAPPADAPPAQP